MKQLLLIFIGGGLGSSLRYLSSKWLSGLSDFIVFPTLIINIVGSFIIGLLMGYSTSKNLLSNEQSLFFITGFCGGFTTFSTFALENATLIKNGDLLSFFLYTAASFVLGISFVFLGMYISK